MHSRFALAAILTILGCTLPAVYASSPAIGLATADGDFRVNSVQVWSNSTLFEGTKVETARASSRILLNNGVKVRLATESRAKVYQSRLILEKGSGQLESSAAYPIEVRSLRVYSTTPGTLARVQVSDPGDVMVSAVKGAVEVTSARGVLLAKLESGRAISFDPQAGAAAPSKVSGCLQVLEGKLVVVDEATGTKVQVQGTGLEDEVGNRVEITGVVDPTASPVAGASQLLNAQSFKRVAKSCSSNPAAAAGNAGGGASGGGQGAGTPKSAGAGMSAKTKWVLFGGIGAGSAVAGGIFAGRAGRPSLSR